MGYGPARAGRGSGCIAAPVFLSFRSATCISRRRVSLDSHFGLRGVWTMRYRSACSAAAVVFCLATSAALSARQDDGFIPEAKPQPPAAKSAGGDRLADTVARLV